MALVNGIIESDLYDVPGGKRLGDGSLDVYLDAADQGQITAGFEFSNSGSTLYVGGLGNTSSFIDATFTDLYTGKLKKIDASDMKGNLVIGGVAEAILGTGTNVYSATGYSTGISSGVSNVTLQKNAGNDTIRFVNGSDKVITVTNFDPANDYIALVGTTNLDSLINGPYSFTESGQDLIITGSTGSQLTLKGIRGSDTLNVITDTTSYQLYRPTSGSTDKNYWRGVKLYLDGSMYVYDGIDAYNGTVYAGLGTQASEIMTTSYGDRVATSPDYTDLFNGKSASCIVMGNTDRSSTIYGGTVSNLLYGGSQDADELYGGGVSAKDCFWWGINNWGWAGDGHDTIDYVSKDDYVYLWNVSSSDISRLSVQMNADKSVATIVSSPENTLTINSGLVATQEMYFETADNQKFVYSSLTGGLVQKL